MIYGLNDYNGCRVIVYDEESGHTIAEGKITKFERTTYTISIPRLAFREAPHGRVFTLIFYEDALHEYRGMVHKTGQEASAYSIGLFKGKEKESRESVRYAVSGTALVEHYVIAGRLVPLRNPLEVTLINISTTGCLIRANGGFFNVGATFRMKLKLGDSDMLLTTTVVRIGQVDSAMAEYGCKF